MTFRPDSPLTRLVLLWPGVPIAACALGFGLALTEVAATDSGAFAALAIAMGFGLAFGTGLLFHTFFVTWLEVQVTPDGLALRPLGLAWIGVQPQLLPWTRIREAQPVATRTGGHLSIAAAGQVYKLERALFREDTYQQLCRALTQRPDPSGRPVGESGLAAA